MRLFRRRLSQSLCAAEAEDDGANPPEEARPAPGPPGGSPRTQGACQDLEPGLTDEDEEEGHLASLLIALPTSSDRRSDPATAAGGRSGLLMWFLGM